MPVLGHEKLKNITPPTLDKLFTDLQKNGNLEHSFQLKDREIFDGVKRDVFVKKACVSHSVIYHVLRGGTIRRGNVENIAAGLNMKFSDVFDDVTENPGMTGASVNKLKLNLSAIFIATLKIEIMRRNPCKLATPPRVDTVPAEYLYE